ncbi:MAG: hypothetical protein JWM24_540 [Solirubrobacterales bacterium]|nr:hypothetical protein [Solirubrobacterales bacterium]
MKRRISSPRAATVVALAAVVALAIAVTPSLAKKAQSFLTSKKAAATFVTNKKAATLYLKKKQASNLYVAKATAPRPPVVGIAAGTAQFGPVSALTAGYVPTAFTSFATPAKASSVVITFSGNVSCTALKPTAALACPVQLLVDNQSQGKVNIAPAVAASPTPALLAESFTLTTVLGKGGHTVALQYAGAKDVTFTLKGWNLAVQAFPQPEEAPVVEPTKGS